jgi:multisubunit Na+/H+ antiporter MnhB subunit
MAYSRVVAKLAGIGVLLIALAAFILPRFSWFWNWQFPDGQSYDLANIRRACAATGSSVLPPCHGAGQIGLLLNVAIAAGVALLIMALALWCLWNRPAMRRAREAVPAPGANEGTMV